MFTSNRFAGYPDEQDLYLAVTVQVDGHTGEFVMDANDMPQAPADQMERG